MSAPGNIDNRRGVRDFYVGRATDPEPSRECKAKLAPNQACHFCSTRHGADGYATPPTGGWIQTFSGQRFEPLNPDPATILIEDIAHALSNVCRYSGHSKRFYSVAEHSVRVARRVEDLTGDPALALWGLLHDASEAYIADIARPVKHLPELAGYRQVEARLQAAICEKFGLPVEQPEVVTRADLELLGVEASILMAPMHPDWIATAPKGAFPPAFTVPTHTIGWHPDNAEHLFLSAFDELVYRCALRHGWDANGAPV